MGYYIQGPAKGKAAHIVTNHGGTVVDRDVAGVMMHDNTKAVIVVMSNGPFDAAGFAFDHEEFKSMTLPHDSRRKTFIVMERAKALELTGFREEDHANA